MERIDDMPDDHHGNGFDTVIAALEYNRYLAGGPVYAEIASVSLELAGRADPVRGVRVGHLPRSTANELMRGKRSCIRNWELVASLWATIFEIAERRGRDTAEMISLEELRVHHDAAGRPPRPGAAPVTPAGIVDAAGPQACAAAPVVSPTRAPTGRMAAARLHVLAETKKRGRRAWWRAHGDVVPDYFEIYLTLEPELSVIRTYAPKRVPGLLQTEYYAHKMIGLDFPGIGPGRRARLVELCRRRQEILYRPDPPQLWVLMDERALRATPDTSYMMRGQLNRLIELAGLRHVTIQLVPEKSAEHAVTEGPITIMQLPERHQPYLVYIEHRAYGLYPHESNDVDYFVHAFGRLAISAWTEEQSVERLHGMLERPWVTDG